MYGDTIIIQHRTAHERDLVERGGFTKETALIASRRDYQEFRVWAGMMVIGAVATQNDSVFPMKRA